MNRNQSEWIKNWSTKQQLRRLETANGSELRFIHGLSSGGNKSSRLAQGQQRHTKFGHSFLKDQRNTLTKKVYHSDKCKAPKIHHKNSFPHTKIVWLTTQRFLRKLGRRLMCLKYLPWAKLLWQIHQSAYSEEAFLPLKTCPFSKQFLTYLMKLALSLPSFVPFNMNFPTASCIHNIVNLMKISFYFIFIIRSENNDEIETYV